MEDQMCAKLARGHRSFGPASFWHAADGYRSLPLFPLCPALYLQPHAPLPQCFLPDGSFCPIRNTISKDPEAIILSSQEEYLAGFPYLPPV